MNFKIYIQKGLIKHISSLEDINYFEFSHSNFTEKINNHIASKISQCFLFFIEYEFLKILNSYMSSFKEAQYQFIIVGHSFDETIKSSLEVPFNKILGISRHFISKEELDWYLFKFEICINYEKHNLNLSDAVKKDFLDDQYELITIGQMLAEERDRDKLIKKILMTSIKITGSDAGCVFLVVDQKGGDKGLLFKYSYTFSRNIDFREFVMPLDESSISGFCAINDEVVNIPDVYHISKDATFSFNRSIDEKYAYISKSMLVIPMKNHLGEMLGVIELINSKENFSLENNSGEVEAHKILLETVEDFETKVFPFAVRYEDIMLSVAGQASIALDNIKMLKQLEDQFEGMVRASVDAIDSKDPATSGHSFRLAKMSVKFLEVLNSLNIGVYKEVFFSPMEIKQMEYAALLHDYGKVYINNEIFLKAKKLFPKDFSILKLRLDLIIQTLISNNNIDKANEVKRIRELVSRLNEPHILTKDPGTMIDEILKFKDEVEVFDGDGNKVPLLTEDEVRNLLIGKGTLNSDERKEIESHVVYTYNFLQSIPWPSDLSRIPEIAGGHHEMLDGSGYPHGLKAEDLSIECRILAILDIFDALSASDRPYKKAVPLNKVYSIMMEEGENGRLDLELLKVFFTHKIFSGIYSRDSDTIMV